MKLSLQPFLAQETVSGLQTQSLSEGGIIAVVGLLIVFLVLIFLSVFIATLPRVLAIVERYLPESNEHHPIAHEEHDEDAELEFCLLYTSPSPRDLSTSRMPSSA